MSCNGVGIISKGHITSLASLFYMPSVFFSFFFFFSALFECLHFFVCLSLGFITIASSFCQ